MKKGIGLIFVIFIFPLIALVAYAQKGNVSLSESDLPNLKGKWVGSRATRTATFDTDLEISNDSLPLKGKIVLYGVKKMTGKRGGGFGDTETETVHFRTAGINDKGNFHWKEGVYDIELTLYKDEGKMILKGDYVTVKGRGTMTFTKR